MNEHTETGRRGEDLAAGMLQSKGYRILERNWHAGSLEVDIIALNGEVLVFVEVKARRAPHLIAPLLAVTRRKQRLLVKAANIYVQRKGLDNECRFDIVTVVISPDGEMVEHIVNAFYALL